METGSQGKIVFKKYTQNQMFLLPPSLEDLIESNHPVRVVNEIIEKVNIDPIVKGFKGGGTSAHHPRMLLKVLVYGYLSNIYSSRKIETACKEQIHFMWLAGMSKPDHNTINRFRSHRLRNVMQEVFKQIVLMLVGEGLISLKETYVDGTKIEADANRYTFVWANSIKTNKERIVKQLDELWEYSQKIAAEELKDIEKPDFKRIDSQIVEKTIEMIDNALKDKPVDKKVEAKLKYGKKNWRKKLDEYAAKEEILDGRNSYSKTDTDATFMRMKEDHLKNGQLKPGYNWQISTANQFIVNYSVHQSANDYPTLAPHLQQFKDNFGLLPESLCADAGYGSEENYQLLENQGIKAYVKYNYFQIEQSKKWKENPFKVQNLHYNEEKDCYYCPIGQAMTKKGIIQKVTTNGLEQEIHRYQAQNCQGCPMRGMCHKAKGNRIIEINHRLNKHKAKARQLLESEEGIRHRSKRGIDVEPVFGNIKSNHGFKRFMLRGLKKVEIELGLLSIAQNLRKKAKISA